MRSFSEIERFLERDIQKNPLPEELGEAPEYQKSSPHKTVVDVEDDIVEANRNKGTRIGIGITRRTRIGKIRRNRTINIF